MTDADVVSARCEQCGHALPTADAVCGACEERLRAPELVDAPKLLRAGNPVGAGRSAYLAYLLVCWGVGISLCVETIWMIVSDRPVPFPIFKASRSLLWYGGQTLVVLGMAAWLSLPRYVTRARFMLASGAMTPFVALAVVFAVPGGWYVAFMVLFLLGAHMHPGVYLQTRCPRWGREWVVTRCTACGRLHFETMAVVAALFFRNAQSRCLYCGVPLSSLPATDDKAPLPVSKAWCTAIVWSALLGFSAFSVWQCAASHWASASVVSALCQVIFLGFLGAHLRRLDEKRDVACYVLGVASGAAIIGVGLGAIVFALMCVYFAWGLFFRVGFSVPD